MKKQTVKLLLCGVLCIVAVTLTSTACMFVELQNKETKEIPKDTRSAENNGEAKSNDDGYGVIIYNNGTWKESVIPNKNNSQSNKSTEQKAEQTMSTQDTYYVGGGWTAEEFIERNSWDNVFIEILDINESGIDIRITDRDNTGFWFNPIYFALEHYEDGIWDRISLLSPLAETQDSQTVYPNEEENVAAVNSQCSFEYMSVKELKPGRYRLSKIVSGGEVCCQFTITETNKVPEEVTMLSFE